MSDLVERYVHQAGRYLPPKERAEIEAELRSQILDKLDDRYGGSPSQAEVAAVLAEFGHPYRMAASYSGEQYLVGPVLYPYMMMVLRNGWFVVPPTVVFLTVFGALVASQPVTLAALVVETVIAVLQATLIFSAVVVLFFALIQHKYLKIDENAAPFNPMELPEVDDPGTVDRLEAAFGIAIGTVFALVLLYFLRVGGLTLRFDLSNPGDVIPAPALWLSLLFAAGFGMVVVELRTLRRNRWTAGALLTEIMLEVFASICLYFAITKPLFERIIADNPAVGGMPVIPAIPEIFAIGYALVTLLVRGIKLLRLWHYQNRRTPSFATRTGG